MKQYFRYEMRILHYDLFKEITKHKSHNSFRSRNHYSNSALKAIVNLAALKPILSWLKNVKISNSGNEIREIRLFFSGPRLSATTLLKSYKYFNN